ncbi:MAG: AsmA family protein [Alphaproteobacteria bacterium]|nr:AsmA family protein [Alphaproteobacteria bacterium]
MKRILLIVAGIVGFLVVAAMVVPFLVPRDVYKTQIEKAATDALKRDVKLAGDVKISVFPRISASIGGVTVANPAGFDRPNMIEAGELRGSVKWLPLLSRRVDVQEISFVDANVDLHRMADGTANWEFGTQASDESETAGSSGGFDAGIEAARLKNAKLTFRDDVAGSAYEVQELDLQASLQALDKPLKAKASGLFQGERFDVDLQFDSPDALTTGTQAAVTFALDSTLGKASYGGNVTLGDAPALSGSFSASSNALAKLAAFAGVALPMDLSRLGKIDTKGNVSGPFSALNIDVVSFSQSSDMAKTDFTGQIMLADAPTITGNVAVSAPSIADLATFSGVKMPLNLAPLGAVSAIASLSGALTEPAIRFETLAIKGSQIDASYIGGLTLGEKLVLDGRISAVLPQAGDLATQMGLDLPARNALERVELKGAIKGPADALNLSDLDVKHSGALLNATYTGAVGLAGDGRINGQVAASSNELRALLKAADVEMAPGDTLKTFNVNSAIAGSFKKLSLTNLTLVLDDITGKGTAGIDLTGDRPKITGNLDMGPLDLSPFLGESDQAAKPKQASTGWSKEPLDLAGLKAVDADVKITTSALTFGNVKLTDAALATNLNQGVLTADLSRFKAFGGDWNGQLGVNAKGATPAVDFTMNGSGVGMSSLLGTLAGFDKLSGTGGFQVTGVATGNSINDIMNALDGKVTTNLVDGELKGLNVSQLVRSAQSLQQALTTGSLKSLDFSSALSPSASTDFSSFDTVLTINDGVANVDLMKLINPVLGIDGSGQINLGGQALDLRLATSIDKSGQGSGSVVQLNGIPVPVRISGSWSKLKVSPDTSGIQSALKAELGNKLKDQLSDKIGGDAGAILGNVLGVPTTTAPAPSTPTPTEGSAPATVEPETKAPVTLEGAAEQAAKDALGDLFKKKKKTEVPVPAEPEPAPPE